MLSQIKPGNQKTNISQNRPANLLTPDCTTMTKYNISFQVHSDGSVRMDGISNGNGNYYIMGNSDTHNILTLREGKYFLCAVLDDEENNSKSILDDDYFRVKGYFSNDTGTIKTFTDNNNPITVPRGMTFHVNYATYEVRSGMEYHKTIYPLVYRLSPQT